jgi:2-hydroxy-3-oxopropionate reductase
MATAVDQSAVKIGFIGLGAMGRPMALHLLHSGYPLGVHARRPHSAAPLVAEGATLYATPAALAASSDVLITMVTTTSDVEEVLLGDDGAATGARPDTIFLDMSTTSAAGAMAIGTALARRGFHYADAPVSGGVAGAEQATLTIMVGADAAVLARLRPILERLGRLIVHVGGVGAGQAAKTCNQLLLLITAEGVAEALALAARLGLDPGAVRQALLGGLASSRVLDLFGARMVDRQFQTGIPVRLYDKDLRIAMETARLAGQELPAAAVVMDHLDTLRRRGGGDHDLSALLQVVERR